MIDPDNLRPIELNKPSGGVVTQGPWIPGEVADAEAVPLPVVVDADTSFDIALDDEDDLDGDRRPVYVDIADAVGVHLPVIPAQFRPANLPDTIRRELARTRHRMLFHAVRLPWYALQTVGWSAVGLIQVVRRQMAWWWVAEQHTLRHAAVRDEDAEMWMRLHDGARETRRTRGIVIGLEAVGVAAAGIVLSSVHPWFVTLPLATGVVAGLARAGRPADRPIVQPAMVQPRFRRLSADIVLRAYYAAKLGNPDKPDEQIFFGGPMSRDASNTGSQVVVDLPFGKHFDDAVRAKKALASGLDVSRNQVFLTPDETSERRHLLFVADRDPLAVPAGRTPLLDCRPRDIWRAAPFGLDERNHRVSIALMWISVLIGAQPRKGKTFSARLLALFAALDPNVKLFVVDGKNSPDWQMFGLVADAVVYGTHPNSRDTDPVGHVLAVLRRVKKHIMAVNDIISSLPAELVPEGKLTHELARDPRWPELRVWMLVLEEFQLYYELDDTEAAAEVADLLSYVKAVGPSAGVILLSASQKPSGIGATQNIQKLFTRFRDNHDARFALKCGNRLVSEAVLGGEAYAEGFDASALPMGKKYRGVGYLYGLTDHTPTVRCHLADGQDAEKICLAGRKHRIAAGTLSGEAAGERPEDVEVRDVLADAEGMFQAGETGLPWVTLAERLRERMPEYYADADQDTVSTQLRALRVPSVDVKWQGRALKGAKLAQIEAARGRREAAR